MDYEALQRSSARASLMGIIGAVLVFGAFLYAFKELRDLNTQSSVLEKQLADVTYRLNVASNRLHLVTENYASMLDKYRSVQTHMRDAYISQVSGNVSEAIKHYDAVLAVQPNYAYALMMKGYSLFKEGKLDLAIEFNDEARRQDSLMAESYLLDVLYALEKRDRERWIRSLGEYLSGEVSNYAAVRYDVRFARHYADNREFREMLDKHALRIRELQMRLRSAGYYQRNSDGIVGEGTYDAIQRMASDLKMTVEPVTIKNIESILDYYDSVASGR